MVVKVMMVMTSMCGYGVVSRRGFGDPFSGVLYLEEEAGGH